MTDRTYTKPKDEDLFAAIGRLAISWAHIELGIDLIVFVAYHHLGGDAFEEKPMSLNRKLKFLRKCFAQLGGLQSLKEVSISMLDDVRDASEARHDVLHGFIVDHPEGSNEVEMIRLLRGGAPNAHKRLSLTTEQILTYAVAANKLASRALGIGTLLLEVRGEILDKLKQPGRKLDC